MALDWRDHGINQSGWRDLQVLPDYWVAVYKELNVNDHNMNV